jgi:multidrug efflux system outer membrane protein
MRSFLFSSAACVLLAACSYNAPKLETADAWQGPTAAVSADVALPDPTWWTLFGSQELTDLVLEAKANNHDLKVAVIRILEAEASARIAASSLFPSLGAGASVNRTVRDNAGGPASRSTNYSGTLQASYQMDLFGQVRNSAAAADQRLESSQYDRETVEITLTSDVITTYLQVLSARQRLFLAGSRLKNAEEILRLLETQRRIGILSELELSQQRAALASQRASLPSLRLAEQQSLHALAVLLGRLPEGFDVKAQSLADVNLPQVAAGIPSIVLTRRPDLRSAESNLKASHFDVNAARAARFPSIDLTASGGTASAALGSLFSAGTLFYSIGASVAQTIFAGGRLAAQQDLAQGRYKEVQENYRQAVLSAFRDVEDALSAVQANGEQYGFQQEASVQADEAYRLAQLRYRAGLSDFQTVLNAQNAAFSAQESVVQSELSRFTAVVGLTQALGGGWDGRLPEGPPLHTLSDPA